MLSTNRIIQRASEILEIRGQKSQLSEQAKAVVRAIVEESNRELMRNAEVLESEAETAIVDAVVKRGGRMVKPTLEQVLLHGETIGLPDVQARKFHDYYEANGWRVGKNPMKLWTAAMANWKRTWQERNGHAKESQPIWVRLKSAKELLVAATERVKCSPFPSVLNYENGASNAKFKAAEGQAKAALAEKRRLAVLVQELNNQVTSE